MRFRSHRLLPDDHDRGWEPYVVTGGKGEGGGGRAPMGNQTYTLRRKFTSAYRDVISCSGAKKASSAPFWHFLLLIEDASSEPWQWCLSCWTWTTLTSCLPIHTNHCPELAEEVAQLEVVAPLIASCDLTTSWTDQN